MSETPEKFVLLNAATATGAGASIKPIVVRSPRTFQAIVAGSAATATVKIQGSNDNSNFLDLATFTLTAAASAAAVKTEGVALDAPWLHVRANITALGSAASYCTVIGAW